MSQAEQNSIEHFKKSELCPKALEDDKTAIRKKEKERDCFENITPAFGYINN